MATLQASTLVFSSSSSSSSLPCSSKRSINATIQLPNLRTRIISIPKLPTNKTETAARNIPSQNDEKATLIMDELPPSSSLATDDIATATTIAKLYAILEAVSDRVEMHENVGEQRENWNSLLLNSINMITLTASAMAGLAGNGTSLFAFKLSSTLLFSAATGILIVMNKIQPSQLTEEQRNASRLFKRIKQEIETLLALRANPSQTHVNHFMDKVLALDKAYPLPLLGVMLEKFPSALEPAVWWPRKNISQKGRKLACNGNGWSEEIEEEMREVAEVIKKKDIADYMRLGNLALKIHKVLAISGPILTGVAAVSSSLGSAGVAAAAGALAAVVNTLEHGSQVGMVVEMCRNCAGFFSLLQESIESTVEEREMEERENGELFEMKVGLELGRSVSQLRDLASKSASSRIEGMNTIAEFASKLF